MSAPEYTYQKTMHDSTVQRNDGSFVSANHPDYVAWLADGNKPAPASVLIVDRAVEIKARLNELDALSIRALRATAAGTATQADTDKLAEYDSEADVLRAELVELAA